MAFSKRPAMPGDGRDGSHSGSRMPLQIDLTAAMPTVPVRVLRRAHRVRRLITPRE